MGGAGLGGPKSDVGGQDWGWEGLYSKVQCIMGNGHMGTPWRQNDGQT